MMSTLRAAMLGTVCVVCGLLAGYQAYKSGQKNARIRLKISASASSQSDDFQISTANVRQQYRYVQPSNTSVISMHTVVPTGCDRWQDFQMAGLYWSFLRCLPIIQHHDSIPSSSKTADPWHCNALLTACLELTI